MWMTCTQCGKPPGIAATIIVGIVVLHDCIILITTTTSVVDIAFAFAVAVAIAIVAIIGELCRVT